MSSFLRIKQCARSLLGLAKLYRTDALNTAIANENRSSFLQPYRSFAGNNILFTKTSLVNNSTDTLLARALKTDSFEAAVLLFKELKTQSNQIHEEYFWPHIRSQSDIQSILKVLTVMREDFGISQPSSATIRQCVVPELAKYTSIDNLLVLLQLTIGCKIHVAVQSVIHHCLCTNNWNDAVILARRYNFFYSSVMFRDAMINALIATKDMDKFVQFLHIIQNSVTHPKNMSKNNDERDIVGDILCETVRQFGKFHVDQFKSILQAMISHGMSIKSHHLPIIEQNMGEILAPAKADLWKMVTLMADGVLTPIPLAPNPTNISPNEIEEIEKRLRVNPESVTTANYHTLLESYFKNKDIDRFVRLVQRLDADDQHCLSNGVYVKWMTLKSFDHEEVMRIYTKVKRERPDFVLNHSHKFFGRLAHYLIKNDRIDEAVAFLSDNRTENRRQHDNFDNETEAIFWSMLNVLALRGRANDVERVCNILLENDYAIATNKLLGPLVMVHLVNKNFEQAVHVFENLFTRYRVTPWQTQLMRELIQSERVNDLQRIVDLCKSRHGEYKTLFSFSYALVECGRKSQAKLIIETLRDRIDPLMYMKQFQYYAQRQKTEYLESFFEITKGLPHFDRSSIYDCLLQCYCKDKQIENILALWQQRIEEALPISASFSTALAAFIHANNVEIPFDVPAEEKVFFDMAVEESGKLTKMNRVKPEHTSRQLWNSVETFVRNYRPDEASEIVKGILITKGRLDSRRFNFYLQTLSRNGNVEQLNDIEPYLDSDQKREYSFDNRLCVAYNQSARCQEYIQLLENRLSNCTTDTEVQLVGKRFPLVAHCIMETCPEAIDQYKSMAEKYAQKGLYEPMNVLWMYHFVEGHQQLAQQIWSEYLSERPVLLSKNIMMKARARKDHQLVEALVELVANSKISPTARGVIYSGLLDIYSDLGMHEHGLDLLRRAEASIGLEYIHVRCFNRFENELKKLGIQFPYTRCKDS